NAHTAWIVCPPYTPSAGPGSKPRSIRRCCTMRTSSPVTPLPSVRPSGTVTTGALVVGAAVLTGAALGGTVAGATVDAVAASPPPLPTTPIPTTRARRPPAAATGIHRARSLGACAGIELVHPFDLLEVAPQRPHLAQDREDHVR